MPTSLESANIGAIAIGCSSRCSQCRWPPSPSPSTVLGAAARDRDSRHCASEVHPLIRKGDWMRAAGRDAGWQARRAPLARVMAAGLAEWSAWPPGTTIVPRRRREAAVFATDMTWPRCDAAFRPGDHRLDGAVRRPLRHDVRHHHASRRWPTQAPRPGAISAASRKRWPPPRSGSSSRSPRSGLQRVLGQLEVLRVELDRDGSS